VALGACQAPAAFPGSQSRVWPQGLQFSGEEQEGKQEPAALPIAAVRGLRVPSRRGARGREVREHGGKERSTAGQAAPKGTAKLLPPPG